jgi:hypothetical protein
MDQLIDYYYLAQRLDKRTKVRRRTARATTYSL